MTPTVCMAWCPLLSISLGVWRGGWNGPACPLGDPPPAASRWSLDVRCGPPGRHSRKFIIILSAEIILSEGLRSNEQRETDTAGCLSVTRDILFKAGFDICTMSSMLPRSSGNKSSCFKSFYVTMHNLIVDFSDLSKEKNETTELLL